MDINHTSNKSFNYNLFQVTPRKEDWDVLEGRHSSGPRKGFLEKEYFNICDLMKEEDKQDGNKVDIK